jgi:hypothetical protein
MEHGTAQMLVDEADGLTHRLALAEQHGSLDGTRAGRYLYQELIGVANADGYAALVYQIAASMKTLALPDDVATSMVATMEEYRPRIPPRDPELGKDDRLVLSTYRLAYYRASAAEWDRLRDGAP